MGAVGDSVEQSLAESGVFEHLSPLGERKIGGHDDRGSFGAFRNHLKQQLRSHIRQRHVAELVNRDQFVTTILFQKAAELVVELTRYAGIVIPTVFVTT